MRYKLLLFATILLILTSQVNAIFVFEIEEPKCNDKGVVSLRLKTRDLPATLKMSELSVRAVHVDSNKEVDINGVWDTADSLRDGTSRNVYRDFVSDEMALLGQGLYQAVISYPSFDSAGFDYIKQNFICPGYYFSCNVVNVTVLECYNKDGVFHAKISTQGFDNEKYSSTARKLDKIDDVAYILSTDERYVDIIGSNTPRGGLPENYFIYEISDDVYEITWNNDLNFVNSFSMIVKEASLCTLDDYPNSRVSHTLKCDIDPASIKAKEPCSKGCGYDDDLCLDIGSRFILKDEKSYCTSVRQIKAQRGILSACSYDYQCKSNNCENGKCSKDEKVVEQEEALEEPKEEIVKEDTTPRTGFFGWLMGLFS
ncbi:hypothetical protein GOV08_05110 [Candidatus Woesearchaeota archaeon]|nr:hypothetical protein [Candidatus Woesearchaeota archaeon]